MSLLLLTKNERNSNRCLALLLGLCSIGGVVMLERIRTSICTILLTLTFTTAALAQAAAPASKQVEIYGQKINYLEAGSTGPTVILLHGLGADSTSWGFTIPALTSKYHVYAPDQIGFG